MTAKKANGLSEELQQINSAIDDIRSILSTVNESLSTLKQRFETSIHDAKTNNAEDDRNPVLNLTLTFIEVKNKFFSVAAVENLLMHKELLIMKKFHETLR